MKKPVLFFLLLLCSCIASAQYVLDYGTFSSTNCNVFAKGVDVKYTYGSDNTHSMRHTTVLGQPTYAALDKGIFLSASYSTLQGKYFGTEYRINFNFKQYYKYTIVINAAGVGGKLRVYPNAGHGGEDPLCSGAKEIDYNLNNNLVKTIDVPSNLYQNYTFSYGTTAGGLPLLNIAHIPVSWGGSAQGITIRKITIIEDDPDPVFDILPKTLNLACGTTSPQTFTVRNLFSYPGVTGYKWIFPANSGWTYNGAPVPSEIQTTSNTLTLTPVCGVTPLPFQVAVTINGVVRNAIPNTISVANPTYSFSGLTTICGTSATYTLSAPVCNGNVQWSVTPAGKVTLSGSGNSVTLNRVADGIVYLTAAITDCSGQQQTVARALNVGTPVISNLLFNNSYGYPGIHCSNAAGNTVTIETENPVGNIMYEAEVRSIPGMQVVKSIPMLYQGGGNYFDAIPAGWYVVAIRPSLSGCTADWYETELEIKDCRMMGMQQNTAFNVAVAPNPAASQINVSISGQSDGMKKESGPIKARLYDFYTNKLVKEWSLPGDAATGNLNVQAVKDGHYILHLKKGRFQESKHLIIQH